MEVAEMNEEARTDVCIETWYKFVCGADQEATAQQHLIKAVKPI